ncbi:hypothetical protein [Pseudomonas sp. Irchel 3F5]|uniref:hypothetical protein n=1 Tax=Pseudomonas sp. Irchel 3F5 TaxID=2009002 RepID=UPI00113FEE6A|nr:hypothetical protein [Pseudomonas sp. Irchel 3F5]
MKQIDWSMAPDWATHFGEETEDHVAGWYRVDEIGIREFCLDADPHKQKLCASYLDDFPAASSLHARLAVWAGEGLPSVGETIERLDINANWVLSEVMYVGTDRVVLRAPSGQEFVPKLQELSRPCEFKRFRPARTAEQLSAEQRVAEERKHLIDEMFHGLSHSNTSETRRICAEIFDKGYRKQVAP